MSTILRRHIPILIVSVSSILLCIQYYVNVKGTPLEFLDSFAAELSAWGTIIATAALMVGGIVVVTRHHTFFRREKKPVDKFLELWVIISAAMFFGLSFAFPGYQSSPQYIKVWDHVLKPGDATLYACLGFAMASATYRSFKARSYETIGLFVAGLLVFLWRTPLIAGTWPIFDKIGSWIMSVPNAAGFRGMIIAVSIGMVVIAIRVILGLERGYLRIKEEE